MAIHDKAMMERFRKFHGKGDSTRQFNGYLTSVNGVPRTLLGDPRIPRFFDLQDGEIYGSMYSNGHHMLFVLLTYKTDPEILATLNEQQIKDIDAVKAEVDRLVSDKEYLVSQPVPELPESRDTHLYQITKELNDQLFNLKMKIFTLERKLETK